MTMHIEMIAAASNFGWPNLKNPLKPTHLAECTLEKFSRCIGHATSVADHDGQQHRDLADEPAETPW